MGSSRGSLEARLRYVFNDRDLLDRALTHRSCAHERGTPGRDNEALEFLGDAVLGLCISEMLNAKFAGETVGNLARTRAFLVSEPNLARKARLVDLGRDLKLGRGEARSGGREKDSLLADAYEAMLGAVHLDGGLEAARKVIGRHFRAQVASLSPGRAGHDDKTDLQEALQEAGLPVPEYRVVEESGPAHRREFRVELAIAGEGITTGRGRSKKVAEQEAARRALRGIRELILRLKEG